MSLSRRGVAVAWRLRALCAPAAQSGLGSVAESTTATAAHFSAASALPILFPEQPHSGSNWRSGPHAYGYFGSRNFSVVPGRGDGEDLTSDAGFAATAGGSGGLDSGAAAAPLVDASSLSAYSPDSIVDLAAIAEKAALELAKEDVWAPTRALQWIIENVHEVTGLPWWGSIMLTTLGIRTATLPIMLMQIKNTHRLSAARPEVEALVEHLKEEQARGNPNAMSEYQTRVAAVWAKHKANPLKSVATLLVQMPLFIGFFSALRGMAAAKVPSLTEGGMWWFTDLTVPDATYALPILASLTFLLTVEVGAADGMEGQPDKMKSKMKNIMRVVALIIVPFSGNMPASVFMYWTASNAFSLLQTSVLKIPGVKQALGLPKTAPGSPGAEPGKPVETFSQKPKPVEVPAAPAVPKIKPAALKKRRHH